MLLELTSLPENDGAMRRVGFQLRERFDAADGEKWQRYLAWSGLALTEVVGLDCSLCPNLVEDLSAEDWRHVIPDVGLFAVFKDLDYLRSRHPETPRSQVLALCRRPPPHLDDIERPPHFAFKGFELIEEATSISALTNCDGFDEAFRATDLNDCGLVQTRDRATRIQAALRLHYPEEAHGDCEPWAIWRRET